VCLDVSFFWFYTDLTGLPNLIVGSQTCLRNRRLEQEQILIVLLFLRKLENCCKQEVKSLVLPLVEREDVAGWTLCYSDMPT